MKSCETYEIKPETKLKIDDWLKRYPKEQRQSAVMQALSLLQEDNGGWLDKPHMDAVAAHLGMPAIAVYEVASFYSMYELKPVGRHKLSVCTNISCMLRGSETIMEYLKTRLDIKPGETTTDGRITLKEVECLGACVNAPVAQLGRDYHENLTLEKLDRLLEGLE